MLRFRRSIVSFDGISQQPCILKYRDGKFLTATQFLGDFLNRKPCIRQIDDFFSHFFAFLFGSDDFFCIFAVSFVTIRVIFPRGQG
jgi:hypothetical protein